MAYTELYMDQGSTFRVTVNLADESTNNTINLASYGFASQMRRSSYSAFPTANIICQVANTDWTTLILTLPAANTSNIKAGRYVYDVEMTDPDGIVTRILEGTIEVTPEVTKG